MVPALALSPTQMVVHGRLDEADHVEHGEAVVAEPPGVLMKILMGAFDAESSHSICMRKRWA